MEGKSSYGGNMEYLKATELKLGPPGTDIRQEATSGVSTRPKKRAMTGPTEQHTKSKVQVVGWPPVRPQRMNSFRARRNETVDESGGVYVKVSMDGAPYLRNIDLKILHGYKELRTILEGMFKCSSLGGAEGYDEEGYAITYEDKDGDLMLVGDVPWEMFVSSCKRLRIMKGSEARGLS
ncbi:Auxin-responsive protein [Rhynchospora pubera]|uniref:Auxin-responsive protein n=1 Tax=Rhynchospora pubera TaxID=906938 RepID=A0AAV8GR41_9POAL|nr:Auxin-responsive protein [Rhynchospora pubera]